MPLNSRAQLKYMYTRIPLKPAWRLVLVLCILTLLVLLAAQPVKRRAWRVIKEQGDNALLNQQYELAKLEYVKLRLINPKSREPQKLIDQVTNGERDILTLRQFYLDHNRPDMVTQIDKAFATYPDAMSATNACQELFRDNQITLALRCIVTTTRTWPTYRDAWLTQRLIAESMGNTTLAQEAQIRALELDPSIITP